MNNCLRCNFGFCGGCGKTKCQCGNNMNQNRSLYYICQTLGVDHNLMGKKDEYIRSILDYMIENQGVSTPDILSHFGYVVPEIKEEYKQEDNQGCLYEIDYNSSKCLRCGKPKRWKDKRASNKEVCDALIK